MQNHIETEERGDQINDRIAAIALELTELLHETGDYIRPHEAGLVAGIGMAYADLSADNAGDTFLGPVSTYLTGENGTFVDDLTPEAVATIILNLPITKERGPHEAVVNKRLALETADRIGPDQAQALYRFAVLVTKLT